MCARFARILMIILAFSDNICSMLVCWRNRRNIYELRLRPGRGRSSFRAFAIPGVQLRVGYLRLRRQQARIQAAIQVCQLYPANLKHSGDVQATATNPQRIQEVLSSLEPADGVGVGFYG